MTKSKERKINSYLKFIGWMAVGGVIGGAFGFGSVYWEEGVKSGFAAAAAWIGEQSFFIMALMLILALVLSVVCYRKGEALLRQYQKEEDDDEQDGLDKRYDFWANMGITGTTVILYLAFPLLGFGSGIEEAAKSNVFGFLATTLLFVGLGVVVGFYQVAAVKQIRKKDPLKKGDAADWNFQKEWMANCDEAEQKLIYEASYKAYTATRTLLLAATVIALTLEFFGGDGLTAAVLLTMCNIISTVIYTYHAVKRKS